MNTKRMAQLVLGIFLGAAACGNSWAQKAEGLADTPPMGWNSWNKFACDIDERLIRETADAMVKTSGPTCGARRRATPAANWKRGWRRTAC